jgi:subtilisin family serine protease
LATALIETAHGGARIVNISAAIVGASTARQTRLEDALDLCRRRGVIVVAAAGNQARVGATAITRHPWVIPVAAYDRGGRPSDLSNLGGSIGRRGLGAPGDAVTSLAPPDGIVTSGGTSVAAPFVTGAMALLWSEFPRATASELRLAVTHAAGSRRHSVIPPLLDAWATYQFIAHRQRG